jgi:hypothetical protein
MINPISDQPERSVMNTAMKLTSWICIFSTALLGCTSTTLIQPEDENPEKLHSGEIEAVIMKDGTKYEFDGDQKTTISAGMVRGKLERRAIAIPLSDVDKVSVREVDTGLTIIVVVGAVLTVAAAGFVIMKVVDAMQGAHIVIFNLVPALGK